jgi:polygalacturonase
MITPMFILTAILIINSVLMSVNATNMETEVFEGYAEVSTYFDGTSMSEEKCDGVVYKKVNDNYYLRQPENNTVNVKWYGAKGDGRTDDYEAIQKACSLPHNVYFPPGEYVIKKGYVKLVGGYTYYGDGKDKSIIVQRTISDPKGLGGGGCFYVHSDDHKQYIKGTQIKNLGFDGKVKEYGHGQWTHLLAFVGTENTVVENCGFYNFRGDGILVSGGLSYMRVPKDIRHNKNIVIRDCLFDGGGLFLNRNGVSFIDVDGALIDNCIFNRIGHKELVKSVGAVDVERDVAYSITKNIKVVNSSFKQISQVNTAGITIMMRSGKPGEIENFEFLNNTFDNCFWGIFLGNRVMKDSVKTTHSDNIIIKNNTFTNNNVALTLEGKKLEVANNKLYGKGNLKSSVKVGMFGVLTDCTFRDNYFTNTGGLGCILVGSLYNCDFINNTFVKARDYSIFFFNDDTTHKNKLISNVTFQNNKSTESTIPFFYFGNNSNTKKAIILNSIIETGNINARGPMYFGEKIRFPRH